MLTPAKDLSKKVNLTKILKGILSEQKIWNQHLGGNLTSRGGMLKKQEKAWKILFEFTGLTEQAISLIIH